MNASMNEATPENVAANALEDAGNAVENASEAVENISTNQ
jgi:hypothetical protein